MKPLLRWLLDSVLPPSCLVCAEPVAADGQFCLRCFKNVNFISPPFCACCGVPFGFQQSGDAGLLCSACKAAPPAYELARAAIKYDETARRMILPFKYGDRAEAAPNLAKVMSRAGAELLQAADILVPVPLHPARLRQRRYNQAALLASALARQAGKQVALEALVRARPTKPLEGMDAFARREELAGAITLRDGTEMQGRRVLLIDDVMTTGTTAHQCALALRQGGAARVDVLTIAHVEDSRLL